MQRSTTLPIHPLTGLRAVYVSERTGRAYWPILGAADGGVGDSGDGDSGDGNGDAGATKTYVPPESQEHLDRIINQAVARAHSKYGMTPEEAKAAKDRADKLDYDLASEKDKAVADARAEERAKANGEATPRVVRAEFKAAAKGVLSAEQLTAILEDLDLSKYVDDKGDADVDKIERKIQAFAPEQNGNGNGKTVINPSLGQGKRTPAALKPGDAGRAQAAKRFGDKAAATT